MPSRFLTSLATAYFRLDVWFLRLREASTSLAAGFFSSLLTTEEQNAASVRLYETAFRNQTCRELRDWERAWFKSRLPPAPARVLVGAAGLGPEVSHLVALGYTVDAFDPSPSAAAACTEIGAGIALVCCYQDLAAAVLDGGKIATEIAKQRYDAIILGLGSLSHLLDSEDRQRLLLSCDRICREGPILASFVDAIQYSSFGRGRGLGTRFGLAGKRLRRNGEHSDPKRVVFGSGFGFLFGFTREDIESLARSIDRRVIWEVKHSDPHVTLVKD